MSRASTTGPLRSRQRLRDVIVRRPRVGAITGLLLALMFALVVTPIVLAESWAVDPRVAPGQIAPVTVRIGADDVAAVVGAHRTGGVIIARGERATPVQAQAVAVAVAGAPRGLAAFAAYGLVLFALAAGFTHHLKRSNRGRLLRVQLVLLGTIALGALVTKGLLLAYPLSVLAVPVALGAIVPTMVFDRTVGLASGVLAAVVMSLLVRFDVGVVTVLVVQAVAASIVIPEPPRARWSLALAAGAVSLIAAALTYMAFAYLSSRALPFEELATPAASSFVAASVGGAMAGVLAMPVLPLFELACGEITHGKLVALEDLSNPLLRQIADKAPGTWQHSLAMANLAEVAANAIGASGRLVRVGAYFHDLGKSLQATYFIENLTSGEPSPHDQLAPEVSCDAIFAHVTEGILLARKHKLPERIIDFMHMHHGDGVLEYFWAKCQEQGNPRHLTVDDFRYPGVPPQSRETAILAVCDAVEAASRTLKRPDARSVEMLVQRIVYGKLHLGQLDESGLSMADLRRMSDSLREAIRHAHHDRIEYPWQREAAAEAAAEAAGVAGATATLAGSRAAREPVGLATQRLMSEPRLDSLDVPRPILWDDRGREAGLGAIVTPTPPLERSTVTPVAPSRATSDLAAFGDTIDLAIATTAGLGAELPGPGAASATAAASRNARPMTAPIVDDNPALSSSSIGPTADALADAVVAAEAAPEPSSRGRATLPPPSSQRLPALLARPTPPASAAVPEPEPAAAGEPPPARAADLDEAAVRRAARPTEPLVVPSLEARASRAMSIPYPPLSTRSIPVMRDEDEPEIEIRVSADDAIVDEATWVPPALPAMATPAPAAPPRPGPPPPPVTTSMTGTGWLSSLSSRIDALLDAEDDGEPSRPGAAPPAAAVADAALAGVVVGEPDGFDGDTVRRAAPTPPAPPPGRSRPIPRVTQPIEPDDVEATLELSPTLRPPAAGVFVGPPPATRAGRSAAAIPLPPAPPGPPPAPTEPAPDDASDGDGDDRPTVVGPQPSGSMLPPRARRGPDH